MEYELYHHGVKGMKWGVRRSRNKRARGAYVIKRKNDMVNKRLTNLNRKRMKRLYYGRDTNKLDKQVQIAKKHISNNQMTMNRALYDLSKDEIDMGRRVVETRYLIGGLVGGLANYSDYRHVVKKYGYNDVEYK